MEYELQNYQAVDAIRIDILVNKEVVEALSMITVKDNAEAKGRAIVKKLKDVIPRQLFEIPIQAAIGGKIIARETVKAFRKDVTAKLYGGDRTRRMKLLKKQSEGKKKMKQIGKVELNQDAFLAVLETE
jgi:GTP-binding protein LepA